ncbi:MAG TPA: hypothetical protein VND19_02030 [Acetobacteraceae bacterium]|nr:hypothetical protein [Acetobacteraceae bacterium]
MRRALLRTDPHRESPSLGCAGLARRRRAASAARPPLDELAGLLAELRAAERLPWPDRTVAAAVEQRYLGIARIAGAEGQKLAASIMDEAERLFATDERQAARFRSSRAS